MVAHLEPSVGSRSTDGRRIAQGDLGAGVRRRAGYANLYSRSVMGNGVGDRGSGVRKKSIFNKVSCIISTNKNLLYPLLS